MNTERRALVKNASDPDQVRDAGIKERRGRERELADMRAILSTQEGRRMIWRYLAECGVFKLSYTGSNDTFFLEGQRNIGLKLLADVNESYPEAYLIMTQESQGAQSHE